MNPYLYKGFSVNWLCLVAMNRSKRSNALSIVLVGLCLVTLCLLAPHARAATKESGGGSDELLLNDIASQEEQGMNKLLHWAIGTLLHAGLTVLLDTAQPVSPSKT